MTDTKRELHLLVAIARLDAALNTCLKEIAQLPEQINKVSSIIEKIDNSTTEAKSHFESMGKERRTIEQELDDSGAKITKLKTQLMEVKTNKEYTAMLHEIEHLEKGIDVKEERLLILMDELDQQSTENKEFVAGNEEKRQVLVSEKASLESRLETLQDEVKKLQTEKPKVLAELDPQLRKRYDRLLGKLRDLAVTHIVDDICQGCFTRLPPQRALEVRNNDQIITCQHCGRILVHYTA